MRVFNKAVLFFVAFGLGVMAAGTPVEKRRVLLENERVRVREVIMEPNVSYPEHTHDLPHVGVFITGGTLEFTEGGQKQRLDFKAGDAGWRESGVTHSIANLSGKPVHVVEVELKTSRH